MKSLRILLLPVVLCGALLATSQADPDPARTNRLFRKLESLPVDTPFATVNRLVLNLIRRNPVDAYRYYNAGFVRARASKDSAIAEMLHLAEGAVRTVKNADLSVGQINRIAKLIIISVQDDDFGHPPPSPTPTPSPTP